MCFSETWFRQDGITEITEYNLFYICRNDGMGGRFSLYVGDKYKFILLNNTSFVSDVLEICSGKLAIGNEYITSDKNEYITPDIDDYHNLMKL